MSHSTGGLLLAFTANLHHVPKRTQLSDVISSSYETPGAAGLEWKFGGGHLGKRKFCTLVKTIVPRIHDQKIRMKPMYVSGARWDR